MLPLTILLVEDSANVVVSAIPIFQRCLLGRQILQASNGCCGISMIGWDVAIVTPEELDGVDGLPLGRTLVVFRPPCVGAFFIGVVVNGWDDDNSRLIGESYGLTLPTLVQSVA